MGIMHPSIMKIRLKDDYLPDFFVYAIIHYMKQRERLNIGTGVKMAIKATDLGEELFPYPSIEVQHDWVRIIKQADKSKLIQNTLLNNKLKFCYCYTPRHISS